MHLAHGAAAVDKYSHGQIVDEVGAGDGLGRIEEQRKAQRLTAREFERAALIIVDIDAKHLQTGGVIRLVAAIEGCELHPALATSAAPETQDHDIAAMF